MSFLNRLTRRKQDEGFGLVELIVVVAILGILVIVAIPVYGAIQNTAERTATEEAAASTYTSIKSLYESEGIEAARATTNKLNAQEGEIFYLIYNEKANGDKPADSVRYGLESSIAAVPELYNAENLRSLAGFATDPGATGEFICVAAFWGNPGEGIKHMGFAGPGCGVPYEG